MRWRSLGWGRGSWERSRRYDPPQFSGQHSFHGKIHEHVAHAVFETRGGLGDGNRARSVDEYMLIEGNENVAGIVCSQQSYVDIFYTYAQLPEG